MRYIIDGHNLIPHMPGMSLSDPQDEQTLIDTLIRFCRQKNARITVFFDQAAPGFAGERNYGLVRAIFVPRSSSADQAIANFVRQLAGEARNHTVVTSDRMVQAAARAHHAQLISSADFARLVMQTAAAAPSASTAEQSLSPEELKEWEDLFRQYGSPPDDLTP